MSVVVSLCGNGIGKKNKSGNFGPESNWPNFDNTRPCLIHISHSTIWQLVPKKPNELLNRRAEKSADKSCDQASSANACVHSLRFKAIAANLYLRCMLIQAMPNNRAPAVKVGPSWTFSRSWGSIFALKLTLLRAIVGQTSSDLNNSDWIFAKFKIAHANVLRVANHLFCSNLSFGVWMDVTCLLTPELHPIRCTFNLRAENISIKSNLSYYCTSCNKSVQ